MSAQRCRFEHDDAFVFHVDGTCGEVHMSKALAGESPRIRRFHASPDSSHVVVGLSFFRAPLFWQALKGSPNKIHPLVPTLKRTPPTSAAQRKHPPIEIKFRWCGFSVSKRFIKKKKQPKETCLQGMDFPLCTHQRTIAEFQQKISTHHKQEGCLQKMPQFRRCL